LSFLYALLCTIGLDPVQTSVLINTKQSRVCICVGLYLLFPVLPSAYCSYL
jgi:hypothetical protein